MRLGSVRHPRGGPARLWGGRYVVVCALIVVWMA
jgi:hypothetical protein